MKKLLVLSLLLLLPLTGCQKNPVTTKKESTTTEIITKNQQNFKKLKRIFQSSIRMILPGIIWDLPTH
ncbi:hypothetical protein EGT49_06020 [Companilactobacillus suantsaicola]|uniref:Uncharacterized protein n=1 Tax=Companilactobacillus suantsaicola TaxID=2487723 RepID=A0A4Z0JM63_9LACO|nr:hypothetical protein EGT49_06020 [Companilactobacillus suantsaicola]